MGITTILKWLDDHISIAILLYFTVMVGVAWAANEAINVRTAIVGVPAENDILPLYDTSGSAGARTTTLNLMGMLESALTTYEIHIDNLPSSPTFVAVTANLYRTCHDTEPSPLVAGKFYCATDDAWDPTSSSLGIDHIVQYTNASTWVLISDSAGNTYTSGSALPIYAISSMPHTVTTQQSYGGWLVVTAAGDVDLPDCETATIGMNVCVEQGDASEVVSVAFGADSSDEYLLSGTAYGGATERELDSPGGAGDRGAYVCLICTEDDLWRVKGREGTWVDNAVD